MLFLFMNFLRVKIFAVPNRRIKVLTKGKAIKYHYRGNGFKHKEEYDPELRTGIILREKPLRHHQGK